MASEDDPTSTLTQRKSLSFHERHTDEWGEAENGTEIIKGVTRNICLEKQK
jgi:hypothetical protein